MPGGEWREVASRGEPESPRFRLFSSLVPAGDDWFLVEDHGVGEDDARLGIYRVEAAGKLTKLGESSDRLLHEFAARYGFGYSPRWAGNPGKALACDYRASSECWSGRVDLSTATVTRLGSIRLPGNNAFSYSFSPQRWLACDTIDAIVSSRDEANEATNYWSIRITRTESP